MPTVKQLLTALGFTIVLFGSSHLIVSYVLMVVRDYNEGNLFRILNYQKLFPGIDQGWQNFVISNIIAVGVYFVILGIVLYLARKKSNKNGS
ncbi:hypothetical protein KDA14_03725 [Candidatus Saccharibacteria bacterium]|nr:hypothetical protein [Candidatus Saccharibacteria bacterium]